MDVSCAFSRGKPREVEEPLFFESPSRGLPRVEKGALIEVVKGVFGLPDSLPVDGGKNCVTLPKETHENLSKWTLPSSARVTFLTSHRDDHLTCRHAFSNEQQTTATKPNLTFFAPSANMTSKM